MACGLISFIVMYLSKDFWIDYTPSPLKTSSLLESASAKLVHVFKINRGPLCSQKQYLVYRCNAGRLCGGIGDREKGMISSFLLALLSNRTFIIDMIIPCRLEMFTRPNQYDWLNCKEYALKVPKDDVQEISIIDKKPKLLKSFKDKNFTQEWTKRVVVIYINWLVIDAVKDRMVSENISSLSWSKGLSKEEIIQRVMEILFQPNDLLREEITNFSAKLVKNRTLVCSHVRIGKNPSIPQDGKDGNTPNASNIITFLQKFDDKDNYTVFVASDSDEFRKTCHSSLKNFINLNRTIIHVDRYKGVANVDACEGLHTAILEQRILSMCDVLVLTRSNFGGIASYMRGKRKNLFMYNRISQTVEGIELEEMATKYDLA